MAVQAVAQGPITRKVCAELLLHRADQCFRQMAQMQLLYIAPGFPSAQIGIQVKPQIPGFGIREGQMEAFIQPGSQPRRRAVRLPQPLRRAAFAAVCPELLDGQGAVDGQRQKPRVRQMEALVLFKLLQNTPHGLGNCGLHQRGKGTARRQLPTQYGLQLLLGKAAAQKRRGSLAPRVVAAADPDTYAGAAAELQPVWGEPAPSCIQVGGQGVFRYRKGVRKGRNLNRLLCTQQQGEQLLAAFPPGEPGKNRAAAQQPPDLRPPLGRLIQQKPLPWAAQK